MSIDKDHKDNYLMLGYSTFGTQMPTGLYISYDQKAQSLGYHAKSKVNPRGIFLNIQEKELVVTTESGNKLFFQKRVHLKPDYRNQVRGSYKGVMVGNYQLLNAQKEYLQDVWFDALGRTNMPDYKRYTLSFSGMNSVHYSPEVHYLKNTNKEELIEKGAVNQEDVMYLYNPENKGVRETFIDGLFIVEKTPIGFKVYTIKTNKGREKVIWGLFFKKSLKYYLIQK